MTRHRRWMLYAPEIEPNTFFFFYFVGESGRSYSIRKYTDAAAPPVTLTQRTLPYMAEQILGLAVHEEQVGKHPVEDIAHWWEVTRELNDRYLGSAVGRAPSQAPRLPTPPGSPSPPLQLAAVDAGVGVGVFCSKDGRSLNSIEDWRAQHPPKHWRAGYSAMELARSWSAAGGLPASFGGALAGSPLAGLTFEHGVVEHESEVPGKGRPSCTDLMVFARTAVGALAIMAVEGKVDEAFGPRVAEWQEGGETAAHRQNREVRLSGLCAALELRPGDVGGVRYQLLHRAFAALDTARRAGATTSVLAIHSLEGRGPTGSNWCDFVDFAVALGCAAVPAGQPFLVGDRDGVAFWMLWVTEPGRRMATLEGGEA